jgi:hypothetical protein
MAKYFNYFPKTFYTSNNSTTGLDSVTNIIARFAFEKGLKENSSTFYKYNIKDSDTPEIIAYKFYGNVERQWVVLLFNDIIDPQFDWPFESNQLITYIDKKYTANGASAVDDTNMPTYLLRASAGTPPYAALLTESINGRLLGDINNSGSVLASDSRLYTLYNEGSGGGSSFNYIVNVLRPTISSNTTKYASLINSKTGITWAMSNYKNYYKVITTTASDGTITINKIQVDGGTWSTISNSTNTYTTQAGQTVTVAITKERQTYYDYEVEENEAKREINLIKSDFLPQIEKEFKRVVRL